MNPFKQEAQHRVDACGLLCPEPVMLLHAKVRQMQSGDLLAVVATDPSTTRDVPRFCQFLGHRLLQQLEEDGRYYYLIQKNS